MTRFTKAAAAVVTACSLVSAFIYPAIAGDTIPRSTLEQLVALNPGTTTTDMIEFMDAAADRHGVTPAQFAARSLAEAQASAEASKPLGSGVSNSAAANDGITIHTASATSGTKLGSAAHKGDIFTAPSTTLWIAHGHSGIYSSTTTVVEAPGLGRVLKKTAASSIYVDPGARKLSIATTQENRNAAADWAESKVGAGYNLFFADNKTIEDDVYNCSQIIWAAYMKVANLDLDDNGGDSVFPVDLRDSVNAVGYKLFT